MVAPAAATMVAMRDRNGSLVEHPAAAPLLGLARQGATGVVDFAGREVALHAGDCVGVGPGPRDLAMWDFMARSGRISASQLEQAQAVTPPGSPDLGHDEQHFLVALRALPGIDDERLHGLLRALYVERLEQCLRSGNVPGAWVPEGAAVHGTVAAFRLLPLLLDSLGRAAADHDAATVGRCLEARLLWLPGPERAAAMHWAALGDLQDGPTIASILLRRPAAASAIAALLRAGLARLQAPDGDDRPPSGESPSQGDGSRHERTAEQTPDTASNADPDSANVAPQASPRPRAPRDQALDPLVPIWPSTKSPLNEADPLRNVERRIAELERDGHRPDALAAAWVELGELWRGRLACPSESARALRHAVALRPEDSALSLRTALLCAQLGQYPLAQEYAGLACQSARASTPRSAAQHALATIHLRGFSLAEALAPLRAAAAGQAEAQEQLALLLAAAGHIEAPAALVRAAQANAHLPLRACGLWAEAGAHTAQMAITAHGLAQAMADAGAPRAAAAVLTDSAEFAPSPAGARSMRMQAVRYATRADDRVLAAQLLIRALDGQPHEASLFKTLHEQWPYAVVSAEERVAVTQDMVLLSSQAERNSCLAQAGLAAFQLPGERQLGRLWLRQALASGYDDPVARNLLGQLDAFEDASPDLETRRQALQARIAACQDRIELSDLFEGLAAIEHALGNWQGVVRASEQCLHLSPTRSMAAQRLLRAALRLNDTTRIGQALRHCIAATKERHRQAALLLRLGYHLLQQNQLNSALECAVAVLHKEPSHPLAALLLLRSQKSAPASHLAALLERSENAFPELPTLLCQRVELAQACGDVAQTLTLLERWAACAPQDPRPRQQKLVVLLSQEWSVGLLNAATGLLPMVCTWEQLELIHDACQRAAEGGEVREAATLLLDTIDHCAALPSSDSALLADALRLARQANDPQLLCRALEQQVSASESVSAAVAALWELATLHRQQRDPLAESRCLLRLVERQPHHRDACRRLGAHFAQLGDAPRYEAVQQLLLESQADSTDRQRAHLNIAAARLRLHDDLTGAQDILERLVREDPDNAEQSSAQAASLLLGLAPQAGVGLQWGMTFAQRLPRRVGEALAHRLCQTAAVVLEAPERAVVYAAEAHAIFPAATPLFDWLEAFCVEQNDGDSLEAAYLPQLSRAESPTQRAALQRRLASALESMEAPERALPHLLEAHDQAPGPGTVLSAIERLSALVGDEQALLRAYRAVAQRGPRKGRSQYAQAANAMAQRKDDGRTSEPPAAHTPSLVPSHLSLPPTSLTLPPGPATWEGAPLHHPTLPAPGGGAAPPVSWPSPIELDLLHEARGLQTRNDPQALDAFLQLAKARPGERAAWQGLLDCAHLYQERALQWVAQQVVDLLEHGPGSPTVPPLELAAIVPVRARNLWSEPLPAGCIEVLTWLWHLLSDPVAATPETDTATDRLPSIPASTVPAGAVPLSTKHLSDLWSGCDQLQQALGLEAVPIYPDRASTTVQYLQGYPPAVRLGTGAELEPLRPNLARALVAAQPGLALLSSLSVEQGSRLLAAAQLVLPADQAAEVETNPQRADGNEQQWRWTAALRERLTDAKVPSLERALSAANGRLDFAKLQVAAQRSAMRAGLLAATDLHHAVRTLFPEIHGGLAATSAAELPEGPLADLLRTSLAPSYLESLGQTSDAAQARDPSQVGSLP